MLHAITENNEEPPAIEGVNETHRIRLFLVDDDNIVLTTLHAGLVKRGYQVNVFATAASALEAWRQSPPDAAIVDVGLPDMGGGELVERMLAISTRPILALSQYHDAAVVNELVECGVSNYLVKPVSANQIVPPIQLMLSNSRRRDALFSQHLYGQEREAGQLDAVLDQFVFGVLIIDGNHMVVRCNEAATHMLGQEDIPMYMVNRSIEFDDPTIALNFRQMLNRGMRGQQDEIKGDVMSISRGERASSLQLWMTPLNKRDIESAAVNDASNDINMVVIVDPDADRPVATELLRSLFGLTAAESKLAAALVNGLSIERFAKKTNVSYNTARSHLKSIFVKTRTHRQVDLVLLLSKLLGNLQGNNHLSG